MRWCQRGLSASGSTRPCQSSMEKRSACMAVGLFAVTNDAVEDALTQPPRLYRVGQFGGLLYIPQAQVGGCPNLDPAEIRAAERSGGMGGHTSQSLTRGQTEQGAGQIQIQGRKADRRGAGIGVAGQGHRHAILSQ